MEKIHLDKIIELANIHAPKYVFGMYSKEDLIQEAILMGVDAYKRWDGVRPFANFICKHISNRLKTWPKGRAVKLLILVIRWISGRFSPRKKS